MGTIARVQTISWQPDTERQLGTKWSITLSSK